MREVFTEAIALPNLPFTVLLAAVVIYWLLVAIGFLQFDHGADVHHDVSHDLATETALEAGVDGHVDAGDHSVGDGDGSGDHGAGSGHGFFVQALHFVNGGQVPAMIVLSVWVLASWMFAMMANHYFSRGSWLWAAALVLPNVVVSAIVTRYLTWPLAKFFGALNREYDEHQKMVGRTCIVATSEVTDDFGQARIDRRGAPLLINVRSSDGAPLRKGETGLVVREDKNKNVYYVVKVAAEKMET